LIRKYALPTVFGIVMAASAYAVSLPLLLWMTPVIIGLVLSIPIAMLSSRLSRPNSRLFRTPEESAPPPVLVRANQLASAADEIVTPPLRTLKDDRQLLEKHLANLPVNHRRHRGQIDPHLAIARAKIEDAQSFDEAVGYLTAHETFAVLNSPNTLRAVCAMPPAQEHQQLADR
jgi:membrane glycosyltransferase